MSTTNSTVYTFSVFAKAKPGNSYINGIRLRAHSPNRSCSFNVVNGTVGATNEGSSSISSKTIVEYPNGWYRCIMTFTSGTDGNHGFQIYVVNEGGDNVGLNNSSANGEAMYFWGAQLEIGSFATSFIPTQSRDGRNLGKQTIRGADTIMIDGENFTEFYNPIESTILVDYTHDITSSQLGNNQRVYKFRAVGGSDTRIDYVSNSGYNPYIAKDASAVASISHGQATVFGGGVNRSAVRVKENSFAVSFNGSAVSGSALDTSGAWNPTNAITEVSLGSGTGTNLLNGHIKRFMYYRLGLSNSQLVTLTS